MARFGMSGLDSVIAEMRKMGQESGAVADAMLLTGAAEVREAWRRSAEEHGHRDTGDMIESIGFPRAPQNIGGIKSIDIYPQGVDRRGKRNAEKAFILHYGTSKMQGSRWVDDADRYSEDTVVPAMTAVWDTWIKTGSLSGATSLGGGALTGIRTTKG